MLPFPRLYYVHQPFERFAVTPPPSFFFTSYTPPVRRNRLLYQRIGEQIAISRLSPLARHLEAISPSLDSGRFESPDMTLNDEKKSDFRCIRLRHVR